MLLAWYLFSQGMKAQTRLAVLSLITSAALAASVAAVEPQARPQRPAPKPAAPAQKPAAAVPEVKVPFWTGETLTYNVGWSSYFTAGSATMRVAERREVGPGRAAYVLVAEGKPASLLTKLYDLYYKAETQLDTRSLQPLTASIFSKEGSRTRVKTTHFKGPQATTADYEVRTTNVNKRQLRVPKYTQDALAAIYVLRTVLRFTPGDRISMPVASGGDIYNATAVVGGALESVRTGAGTFQAWKVAISATDIATRQPAARGMAVWFSNDARRLPVKMEAGLAVGSFTLTLSEAR
jgi:hypothetical protein